LFEGTQSRLFEGRRAAGGSEAVGRAGVWVEEGEAVAVDDGTEDFLSFEAKPASPSGAFDAALGAGVSGLRLVEGRTLEMLDGGGAPRLRVAPPYIVGADGVQTEATLAVEGCDVDTNPAAPWGRPVTAPGASTCTLRVTWDDTTVAYPAVLDPRWTTTGSMTTPRQGHTATLLSTGNVLVVGGTSNGATALASAELYNRTTGSWAATASLTGARTLHTATQLNTSSNATTSGKVLIAGGLNGATSQNTAQLYSPSAGTWTAAGNLNAPRHGHTATLLASGKILVTGGLNDTTTLNTAAVYDPTSGAGSWTATTGPMPSALKAHAATLVVTSNSQLGNKVLVYGGNTGSATSSAVYLFDPTSLAFSTLSAMPSAREGHTATVLTNGNILVTGGKSGTTTLATTALFNPGSGIGSWTSAGTMTSARQGQSATLLSSGIVANGQVLVAGGSNGTSSLSTAELWNGTSTWTATTAMAAAVQGHTATLLPSNMILIAGGVNGTTTVGSAAIYDPSFGVACTSNSQCGTGFCVSGVCCNTACTGACSACNLAGLVGTCSPKANGATCTDGNACTIGETCQAGSCAGGTAVTCTAADSCHTVGACVSATGCPTPMAKANGTTCNDSNACTSGETCQAGACTGGMAVTCPGGDQCHTAGTCVPATGCPAVANGTACNDNNACTGGDSCQAGSCLGGPAVACTTNPTMVGNVLGFEAVGSWEFGAAGTIVGLNPSHTQGVSSLEVAAQNYAPLNSVPMSSIGPVGPLVLLDLMLPTQQGNPFWFGAVQMFVSSPSQGINMAYLGQVELTGLPVATWQTLAFQLTSDLVTKLSTGTYSDLSFQIVLNVPFNETGHYLLDNLRFDPDVVPTLDGIATNSSGVVEAVFDYTTTAAPSISIPYGRANALADQNGFIAAPARKPPETFTSATHAPFVATLSGSLLTWTVGSHSVTATPQSTQLPTTTLPDGTKEATLPNGEKVNLDSVPPQSPAPQAEPAVGAPFAGQLAGKFSVGPSGAATYTVPIVIPPGVAGMAPNLSLVYNSQGPDGIAGQGWDLSGLSTIYRCPRTRADDGYGRPVTLDALDKPGGGDTDGICLDGGKLFEDPANPGHYTPEKNDFSKIVMSGNAFTVTTKAGETRYYGLNSLDTLTAGSQGSTGTAIWLLDRVVDSWGNYFDVHYNENNGDFATTGIRVSEIDYTGHLSGSTTDVSPFSSVKFAYEARQDLRWNRIGATRIPKNRRLTTITTSRGVYTLSYALGGTGPSGPLLQSIGYCSGATCLQPLNFSWPSNNFGWSSSTGYALPADLLPGQGLGGTQFVDVDGDGRQDLVIGRKDNGNKVPQREIYRNTGQGWPLMSGPAGAFPALLDGLNAVRFADMDGDGALDLILDSAQVGCTGTSCMVCASGQACTGTVNTFSPAVWLNRIGQNGGWEFHPEYNAPNATPLLGPGGPLEFNGSIPSFVVDVDGDGLADIAQASSGSGVADIGFMRNLGPKTGWATPYKKSFSGSPVDATAAGHFVFSDINRDGLPDVVSQDYYAAASQVISAQSVLINRGLDSTGAISFANAVTRGSGAGLVPATLGHPIQAGDLDGDGFYDFAVFYPTLASNGTFSGFVSAVGFGDGTGSGLTGLDSTGYNASLVDDVPNSIGSDPDIDALPEDYGFALADLNGDGLVDLIRNHYNRTFGPFAHLGGGEVRFNTGTNWGTSTWQFPAGPNAIPGVVPGTEVANPTDSVPSHGSAFVDLDGDGILDFVQEEVPRGSWLNTTVAPRIISFPNGLAQSTQVTYSAITQSSPTLLVYVDDQPVAPGTRPFITPLRVVSTVMSENATGALSETQYVYHSLRQDPNGRGPQGFNIVQAFDLTSKIITTTTYAQAYPYTGLPLSVGHALSIPLNSPLAMSLTTTSYCDSVTGSCSPPGFEYPPNTSLFVFPSQTIDATYLNVGFARPV